jgi:hypothetical protein
VYVVELVVEDAEEVMLEEEIAAVVIAVVAIVIAEVAIAKTAFHAIFIFQ